MTQQDEAQALVPTAGRDPQVWTAADVETIKRHIAPGIGDDDLRLFARVCRQTGLDPFTKQIYAIMRSAKVRKPNGQEVFEPRMTIQASIDGYRLIATRTGALAGIDDAVFDTEDAAHPRWARVTVWRFVQGQRCPFTATARWAEYSADSSMWRKMPYLMLAKCAEALALRKAFPAELSGVYTSQEMAQADGAEEMATGEQIHRIQGAYTALDKVPAPLTEHELAQMSYADATALIDSLKAEYLRTKRSAKAPAVAAAEVAEIVEAAHA